MTFYNHHYDDIVILHSCVWVCQFPDAAFLYLYNNYKHCSQYPTTDMLPNNAHFFQDFFPSIPMYQTISWFHSKKNKFLHGEKKINLLCSFLRDVCTASMLHLSRWLHQSSLYPLWPSLLPGLYRGVLETPWCLPVSSLYDMFPHKVESHALTHTQNSRRGTDWIVH